MASENASAEPPALATRLLDAAASVVGRHGLRRTTMDDVARAAGCSRQTVYKHHPTREHLFSSLFIRESERYIEEFDALLDSREPIDAEQLVDAFVFTLRYVAANPTVRGVVEADERGLVDVMALGNGAVMAVVTNGVTKALTRFIAAGVVRAVEPSLFGEAFVRLVASFLVLPPLGVDPNDEVTLRMFVRHVLL